MNDAVSIKRLCRSQEYRQEYCSYTRHKKKEFYEKGRGEEKKTYELEPPRQEVKKMEKKIHAPARNQTRVCTVAGYYSTTRPLVPDIFLLRENHVQMESFATN
ncbi:hypothetical protein DITRI_Ditri07aG0150000 [Diplodiscus trichospermus]